MDLPRTLQHRAGRELTVELGGKLATVHAYLPDAALQDAGSDGQPVELAEEVGNVDPLVEQLLLALDGVVRGWEPSAHTYVDHLRSGRDHREASRPRTPASADSAATPIAAADTANAVV